MSLLKKEKIDYFIVFAVFLQSALVILQAIMIDVFRMDAEATTIYRVILSAIPMSLAIILSFRRNPTMFFITYLIAILLLLLHTIIFPNNAQYIEKDSLRFLLPMVIPSALCLITVRNIDFIEKVWYQISWIVFAEVLIYVLAYFGGLFFITDYNMSFSYGCLLPMSSLYHKKNKLSVLASLLMFIVVVSIGSRGAAIIFLAYIVFDVLQNNKKLIIPLLLLLSFALASLPTIISFLDSIGLQSRTLDLLATGQIGNSSGRDNLYDIAINTILDNPFIGVGLWGDRVLFNGGYCHNILIEIFLNWGILVGIGIIGLFGVKTLQVYFKSDKLNKNRIISYFLIFIGPLMASGSYLTDYDFGIFCGLIYLLYNKKNSVYSISQ